MPQKMETSPRQQIPRQSENNPTLETPSAQRTRRGHAPIGKQVLQRGELPARTPPSPSSNADLLDPIARARAQEARFQPSAMKLFSSRLVLLLLLLVVVPFAFALALAFFGALEGPTLPPRAQFCFPSKWALSSKPSARRAPPRVASSKLPSPLANLAARSRNVDLFYHGWRHVWNLLPWALSFVLLKKYEGVSTWSATICFVSRSDKTGFEIFPVRPSI